MTNRYPIRLSIAGAAGLVLATALPLTASAHVTIAPNTAEPGGYTTITAKVPNESATAQTSTVRLDLPADTPFTSVRYVPVPGWSTELTTTSLPEPAIVGGNEVTEAVTSVTWTAQPGSEIGDGQLQQFDLSVGPVPDTGSLTLPATQTYTDGEVVEWDETAEDAEYPAPILFVTDAPVDEHGADATADGQGADAAGGDASTGNTASAAAASDVLARVVGAAGLILGAVAVVLAVTARRRRSA